MNNWLNKLRAKPKKVKDRYAFTGSAVLTGLIAVAWLISFPHQSDQISQNTKSDVEVVGAFSQFFSGAKGQIGSVIASFKNLETVQKPNQVNEQTVNKPETDNTEVEMSATTTEDSKPTNNDVIVPKLTDKDLKIIKPTTILIATSSKSSASNTSDGL